MFKFLTFAALTAAGRGRGPLTTYSTCAVQSTRKEKTIKERKKEKENVCLLQEADLSRGRK